MRKKISKIIMIPVLIIIFTFAISTILGLNDNIFAYVNNYVSVPANKKVIDTTPPSENVQADSKDTTNPQTNPKDAKGAQTDPKDSKDAFSQYSLENATYAGSGGKRMIKDPDDLMVLVNKSRNLSSDYEPEDLVIPKVTFAFKEDAPRKYMRQAAAKALEELFNQARKENIKILATSGYRSFDTQKRIFANNAKIYGEKQANMVSAYAGQSEHQTGLAMDITSASVGYQLEESFGDTAEGKWLKVNAAKFGFIIRYPKGKESITGYSYEPWHVRYVGKEAASEITAKGITFEEYLNAVDKLY